MNTILRKQFLAHVGQTSPEPMMIEVARAEGVFFYTPEGKRYYDLVAGVSVSNVGHANPRVVEAVERQAADYMHIMVYGEMIERPQVRYAARIAELLPGELSSVYFVNSGAEAPESLGRRQLRLGVVGFQQGQFISKILHTDSKCEHVGGEIHFLQLGRGGRLCRACVAEFQGFQVFRSFIRCPK